MLKDDAHRMYLLLFACNIIIISLIIIFVISSSEEEGSRFVQNDDGSKELSIEKVSKNTLVSDYIGQQVRQGEIRTAFGLDGMYYGTFFRNVMIDDENQIRMKITQELHPDDGIIDMYMFETIEENTLQGYIFVDNDWKKQLPDSSIFWGPTFQNTKKLVYDNEVTPGVFLIQFEDDITRFSQDMKISQGGVLIGDISQGNIDDKDFSNSIVVRYY